MGFTGTVCDVLPPAPPLCWRGFKGTGVDGREELEWMKLSGGKREIEAVCESWVGGLIGYLTWKLRSALGLVEMPDGEMDEDIMALEQGDESGYIESAVEETGLTAAAAEVMEREALGWDGDHESYVVRELEEDILALGDDEVNQSDEDILDLANKEKQSDEDILDLDDDMSLDDLDMDIDGISDI